MKRSARFTINVGWTFTLATPDDTAFHASRRIGDLAGGPDTWYSLAPDQIDEQFARATALILRIALPYLQRYTSVESIVRSHERGDLTIKQAFGPDRGWQLFHLGFCHAFLGRTNDAVSSLQASFKTIPLNRTNGCNSEKLAPSRKSGASGTTTGSYVVTRRSSDQAVVFEA